MQRRSAGLRTRFETRFDICGANRRLTSKLCWVAGGKQETADLAVGVGGRDHGEGRMQAVAVSWGGMGSDPTRGQCRFPSRLRALRFRCVSQFRLSGNWATRGLACGWHLSIGLQLATASLKLATTSCRTNVEVLFVRHAEDGSRAPFDAA